MDTKQDKINLALITACQAVLPDLREKFEAIYYPSENVAVSAITTLTRIKMLEVIAARVMSELLHISPFDAGRILEDLGKNALINMVAAGALKVDMADGLYKKYAMEDVLKKAAEGPPLAAKDFSDATSTLSEAMERIAAQKID